jgi:hypothetical protein
MIDGQKVKHDQILKPPDRIQVVVADSGISLPEPGDLVPVIMRDSVAI